MESKFSSNCNTEKLIKTIYVNYANMKIVLLKEF